jgi:deoxycytidylate deaminase
VLNKCIQLASKLQNQKQRVYSIIVDKRGRVLSSGSNHFTKSHPRQAYYCELATHEQHKIYLHAELSALVNLKDYDKAETIYVARVNKKGQPLPSHPCPICQMAIKDAGITKIVTT